MCAFNVTSARTYLQECQQEDQQRIEFSSRMIEEIAKLTQVVQERTFDLEREQNFNRKLQLEHREVLAEKSKLEYAMNRDPFYLVLIDGDGMIFEDQFLQQGENGGREAAALLSNLLRDHIDEYHAPDGQYKIIVRVYANLYGLADTCVKHAIVSETRTIERCFQGFTRAKALFDFIDVGPGKDRADEKITESVKMFLHHSQCRQIFLGCSHDNGYARLLEEFVGHHEAEKVSLVEAVPFERELAALQKHFKVVEYPGLFRLSKLPTIYPNSTSTPARYHASLDLGEPSPPASLKSLEPALEKLAISAPPPQHQPAAQPTEQVRSEVSKSMWKPSGKVAEPEIINIASERDAKPSKTIDRNRLGQRVDPPVKADSSTIYRLRGLKLCNTMMATGTCSYGGKDWCDKTHQKLTKPEHLAWRCIVREIPCTIGGDCDDPDCYFGHECHHVEPGSKSCYRGSKCRFPAELHGIDRKIVKTTKVT